MEARDTVFNKDDYSSAQIIVKACTFIASILSCVVEKLSIT